MALEKAHAKAREAGRKAFMYKGKAHRVKNPKKGFYDRPLRERMRMTMGKFDKEEPVKTADKKKAVPTPKKKPTAPKKVTAKKKAVPTPKKKPVVAAAKAPAKKGAAVRAAAAKRGAGVAKKVAAKKRGAMRAKAAKAIAKKKPTKKKEDDYAYLERWTK